MLRYPRYGVIWSITRGGAVFAAVLLSAPFVALALAPVLLLLVPLAFIAIPLLIFAFFPGASINHTETRRSHARRLQTLQQA